MKTRNQIKLSNYILLVICSMQMTASTNRNNRNINSSSYEQQSQKQSRLPEVNGRNKQGQFYVNGQQKTKEKSLITSCYTNVQKLLTKKKGRASKLSTFSLFYLFTKATLHTYKQPKKKEEYKRTA
jgi:hypothetical protein